MMNLMKNRRIVITGILSAFLLCVRPVPAEAAEQQPETVEQPAEAAEQRTEATEQPETAEQPAEMGKQNTEASDTPEETADQTTVDLSTLPEIADGTYIIEEFDEDRLHYYELSRSDAPVGTPLLILLHGTTMKKGDMYWSAKIFADMGYVVAVPDLPGHGEDISETPLNMYDIVLQTEQNIADILSMYTDVEYVNAEDFCVAGFSLGGFTALHYAAYSERKPQCVLSFCGTPVWSDILDTLTGTVRQSGGNVAIATEAEKEQVRDLVLQNSPDQNMEELLSVPILMVNGEMDDLIPADSIRGFEQTASGYPNQLEVIVMEGLGHDMLMDIPEVGEFLEEYLPVPEE